MKKFLFTIVIFCNISLTSAQVSNGFEGITGRNLQIPCLYVDTDGSADHQLQNYNDPDCGIITVLSPGNATTLGFENIYSNNGNGTGGLSEGDAFGVATNPALSFHLGANAPEGSQAFLMEDTDGAIAMKFDKVNLTGTANPQVSLQYFLAETTWETADILYIHIEITDCAGNTSVAMIDTRTQDIDDLSIEGSWNTLSENLTAYVGCNAQLIVEFSSDSNSEEFGLDDIEFTEGIPLPVELISFTAKERQKKVLLNWSTASELNNDYFEIQRSINGDDFETVGKVRGFGNSNVINHYEFEDPIPVSATTYYRLKQTDFNSDFAYSKIIVVEYDSKKTALNLFPVPASNELFIELPENLSTPSNSLLRIYDKIGQLVFEKIISNNQDQITIPLNNLPKGTYFLNLHQNQNNYFARFVKG